MVAARGSRPFWTGGRAGAPTEFPAKFLAALDLPFAVQSVPVFVLVLDWKTLNGLPDDSDVRMPTVRTKL